MGAGGFKLTRPRRARPPEQGIKAAIVEALQFRRRDVTVWTQNSGAAMMTGRGGRPQPVRFASIDGIADIVGLIKPWGVHLEIEVKVPGGKQRPSQLEHERRIRDAGGVYYVATSVNDALRQLDQVLEELRARFGTPKT